MIGKQSVTFRGLIVLAYATLHIDSFGRARTSFRRIRSDNGTGSPFYFLAQSFELENDCEDLSIENILLARPGDCVPFVDINEFLAKADGDVDEASLALFESTLFVDFPEENASYYMGLTDGLDNYRIANSTNPRHMYDEYKCNIEVLSYSESSGNTNLEVRGLSKLEEVHTRNMESRHLEGAPDAKLMNSSWEEGIDTARAEDLVGERSEPTCITERVSQVAKLKATFKERPRTSSGDLAQAEIVLAGIAFTLAVILTICFIFVYSISLNTQKSLEDNDGDSDDRSAAIEDDDESADSDSS